MAIVVRKLPGDTDDKLIAKFRRQVQANNLLLELKDLEHYKPPSVQRKERLTALKRNRRR